ERGRLREVFQRPHHRRLRERDLERAAMPRVMNNSLSPLAGKPAPETMLVDVGRLEREYYERGRDFADPSQPVSFGTSGHRGSSLRGTFTEAHVLAISEAIVRHRQAQGIEGPLFVARDTHALSGPAFHSALEVFGAHGVDARVDAGEGYTPTPALSHAIL